MADSYTTLDRITQPQVGGDSGTWGTIVNTNFSLIEQIHDGVASINVTAGGTIVVTTNNGSVDQARCGIIAATGSPAAPTTLQMPAQTWLRNFLNSSTQSVIISVGVGTTVTIPAGSQTALYSDGGNVREVIGMITNLVSSNVTITGGTINGITLDGGTYLFADADPMDKEFFTPSWKRRLTL